MNEENEVKDGGERVYGSKRHEEEEEGKEREREGGRGREPSAADRMMN